MVCLSLDTSGSMVVSCVGLLLCCKFIFINQLYHFDSHSILPIKSCRFCNVLFISINNMEADDNSEFEVATNDILTALRLGRVILQI